MTVETLNNSNEDLISFQEDLANLKNEIDKPGEVKYLKESKDGKYKIYRYMLVKGGTKGGIKKKYIEQIGPWVEGTQFTDKHGKEIEKNNFEKGEVVYLRVPKQEKQINSKEANNNAGKVKLTKSYKDKENKDWKIYEYTFLQGGTLEGVKDKFREQIGIKDGIILHNYANLPIYLCDTNGNKLSKSRFNKGEKIYFKAANVEIVNTTPEMSLKEIMNLSDKDVIGIYNKYSSSRKSLNRHSDKNGTFIIVNNRKIYEHDYGDYINNRTYIHIEAHESSTNVYNISIRRKQGKNISGVFYDDLFDVYRGKLEIKYNSYDIYPEGYENRSL